jgi:hypothetical protein
MKHEKMLRYLLILGCFFSYPIVSRAEPITSFQLSLFHPAQIFSDDYNVDGFRFNLIYGVNEDLRGIDLGLFNESRGNAHVFELGLDNRVGRDFGGVQIGLFNEVKREVKGVQLGLLANIDRQGCEGVQMAVFYNDSQEELKGLQLGIVNHAGSLDGVQIGILNFNDDTRYMGFFPFINAAF